LEEFEPTASQMVAVEQATAENQLVPETTWALPGVPLVMVTTTPWSEEFKPTASQVVALEQATPMRSAVPEISWALPGVPLVMVTTTPWLELSPTASQVVALMQTTPSSFTVPDTGWLVVLALTVTPRAPAPARAATKIGIVSQRILVVTDEPPGSGGQLGHGRSTRPRPFRRRSAGPRLLPLDSSRVLLANRREWA
jgi:hypothetical protein